MSHRSSCHGSYTEVLSRVHVPFHPPGTVHTGAQHLCTKPRHIPVAVPGLHLSGTCPHDHRHTQKCFMFVKARTSSYKMPLYCQSLILLLYFKGILPADPPFPLHHPSSPLGVETTAHFPARISET